MRAFSIYIKLRSPVIWRLLTFLVACCGSSMALPKDQPSTQQTSDHQPYPTVTIGPNSEFLPENHLKFYLFFSVPMERGVAFQHIELIEVDDAGNEISKVESPFREVELWDETFTRLTVWLHPGRQKPGVNLNEEFGFVLNKGRHYLLKVSKDWRSESGAPLAYEVIHQFSAIERDFDQPDPKKWKVVTKNGVLMLQIDDSVDPVTAHKAIHLSPEPQRRIGLTALTASSLNQEGKVTTKVFPFLDRLPPGRYRLTIDPILEDFAGNSIARPFDLDLEAHPDFKERTAPIVLPVTVPDYLQERLDSLDKPQQNP